MSVITSKVWKKIYIIKNQLSLHRLMSVSVVPGTKVEEQAKWEKRLEEFCEAREEAIEILKSNGVDLKVK